MEFLLHKTFKKQFAKLNPKLKLKFLERLGLFLNEPNNISLNNHAVNAVYKGWRSINITGDYRALYEIKSQDLVMFMRVGTHSELYK